MANGSGRDSYIHDSNGGFSSVSYAQVREKAVNRSGKFEVALRSKRHSSGDVQKPVMYRQDGKGRDSYID